MGITGNLKTMELSELLQWLSQSRKTGTLVIDNGKVEKRIFFEDGKVISAAASDPKEYLLRDCDSHCRSSASSMVLRLPVMPTWPDYLSPTAESRSGSSSRTVR